MKGGRLTGRGIGTDSISTGMTARTGLVHHKHPWYLKKETKFKQAIGQRNEKMTTHNGFLHYRHPWLLGT